MVLTTDLSHLLNPLTSPAQLETSASQLDGVPKDLEDSVRYETTRLLQMAGVLLRLPQDLIAQSVVILQRFWVGPDGGSMLENDSRDVAAATLYLTAKPTAHAVSPKQLLTVFEYLHSLRPEYNASDDEQITTEHLADGMYEIQRGHLYKTETRILRVLGFQTHVALPYTLCINYLQTLDVFQCSDGTRVAKRAFAHLNSALLSPQLLFLTHQPSAVATAAIYLAARETDAKLPEVDWWEIFDVDREELGFLVVALGSLEGFAAGEKRVWAGKKVPLTVDELQHEIESRRMLDGGA